MVYVDVAVITKQLGDPAQMEDIQKLYPEYKVTKIRRELKNQGWGSFSAWIDGKTVRVWGSIEKKEIKSGKAPGLDSMMTLMIEKGYSFEEIKKLLELRHDHSIANEFAPQTPLAEIHEAADAIYEELMKRNPGGWLFGLNVWQKRYIKAAAFIRVWDDSFPEIERTKSYYDAVNRKHKYAFKCEKRTIDKIEMLGGDMAQAIRNDFIITYCPESIRDANEFFRYIIDEGNGPSYVEEWEPLIGTLPKATLRDTDAENIRKVTEYWKTGHKPVCGAVGKWFMERYNAGLEEAKPEKGAYKPELYRFEAPTTGKYAACA